LSKAIKTTAFEAQNEEMRLADRVNSMLAQDKMSTTTRSNAILLSGTSIFLLPLL
jgi:hypothetical protein